VDGADGDEQERNDKKKGWDVFFHNFALLLKKGLGVEIFLENTISIISLEILLIKAFRIENSRQFFDQAICRDSCTNRDSYFSCLSQILY
jgi:hypothetical protein